MCCAALMMVFAGVGEASARCKERKPHKWVRGNQVPHGKWVECHNKWLKSFVGKYRNGQKVGKWTNWHSNGKKMSEDFYNKKGKQHGKSTLWDADGRRTHQSFYRNGKSHGKTIDWVSDGQKYYKYYEYHNKNGQSHGLYTRWHSDGRVEAQICYQNGKKAPLTKCVSAEETQEELDF